MPAGRGLAPVATISALAENFSSPAETSKMPPCFSTQKLRLFLFQRQKIPNGF